MRAIWSKRSQCYTPCYVVRNSPRYSILRSYSDSSVQGGLGPQIATVPNRAVLSVTGPEPNLSTFLNGLLSTHVVAPSCSETRKGFYSLFLSPQGRILYDIFLHPHPQESTGYLLEFDPRTPTSILSPNSAPEPSTTFPSLPKLLKRYILRSRTRVADVSDQYRVYAYWNNSVQGKILKPTGWRWSTSGSVEPIWNDAFDHMQLLEREELRSKGITGTWDLRAPRMGQRLIVPNEVSLPLVLGTPEVSEDDYTLHRIRNGVPEGMTDMADGLPMERNADMMGGVDFRKGCYVGQELTVRTYHTGLIRKRVVPVKLNPKVPIGLESSQSAPLPRLSIVPAPVTTAASKPLRPRGKGTLLSTIRTPSSTQHSMGLALLRLEHLEATEEEQISLEAQSSSDSHGNWGVVPLRPDWWPVRDD